MITNYFKPKTINEALLLKEKHKNSKFMGGGLTFGKCEEDIVVIDLQKIYLNKITVNHPDLRIGATSTLEDVMPFFSDFSGIIKALRIDASKNIRNVGTIGGVVKSKKTRSPFLNCLSSLRTRVFLEPGELQIDLNDFLHSENYLKMLISALTIQLPREFIFDYVSRSPLDIPVVSVAIAKYINENRIGCGGFEGGPYLFAFKTHEKVDIENIITKISIKDDEWGSAEYKKAVLKKLLSRNITE